MENREMIVNRILEDTLSLQGNYDIDKIMAIRAEIFKYKKQQQKDGFTINYLIEEADLVLRMLLSESMNNSFEDARDIVAPIFEKLDHTEVWSFYNIRILAMVLSNARNYKKVHKFAEDALEELEHHDKERLYPGVMRSIYINASFHYLRAKHGGINNELTTEDDVELDELFANYTSSAIQLCKEENRTMSEAVIIIRRGIYYRDHATAEKGFKMLEEAGRAEAYLLMHDEATAYGLYPKDKPIPEFAKKASAKIKVHIVNELLDEMSDKQLEHTIRLIKKVLHEKPTPKKQDDEDKDNGENKKDEGEGDSGKDK